ncbi:MAG: NUDIX hydrolase [Nocardioidaceae bacterium]
MDPRRTLPAEFLAHFDDYLGGTSEPVPAKDACTVVLIRDGVGPAAANQGAVEVYLLERHLGMAFAGGCWVFPGGGVDPRDFDAEIGWAGPSAAEWARVLACDEATARALVCAAVRETFEESGVLLAGPTWDAVVGDTTGDDWETDRRALEGRELSFTEFLSRRGLVLRTDLLRFWGRWITPEFEPRRYDTRFFAAVLPDGQITRDVSTESASVTWIPAMDAVRGAEAGELTMLPPTLCTCMEVAEMPTAQAVLASAASRHYEPVLPTMVVQEDGSGYIELPPRLVELGKRWPR